MPDIGNTEVASEQNEINGKQSNYFEAISKVNFYDSEWQANKNLQERQAKILELFPDKDALVLYLTKHYQHEYKREEEFAKKNAQRSQTFRSQKSYSRGNI